MNRPPGALLPEHANAIAYQINTDGPMKLFEVVPVVNLETMCVGSTVRTIIMKPRVTSQGSKIHSNWITINLMTVFYFTNYFHAYAYMQRVDEYEKARSRQIDPG